MVAISRRCPVIGVCFLPSTGALTFNVLGIAVLGCLALLGGCSALRGFPAKPAISNAVFPSVGWQLGPGAIERYNAASDPDKKLLRNEIIDARMADIDNKFADYERELYKEGIGSGVGTDWAVLGLTAATTLVGAASTKTALGAVSTATVGAGAAFDKRALFDKTLPALLSQMTAEREKIRASVRAREQLSAVDYTWSAAESDLNSFEYAGSIPGAISVISQDAGEKTGTAKQKLQDVLEGRYKKTASGVLLQSYWKSNGSDAPPDPNHEGKLKKWMTDNGIADAPGMITMFIKSGDEAAQAKAVKDLGIQTIQ